MYKNNVDSATCLVPTGDIIIVNAVLIHAHDLDRFPLINP